MLLWYCPIRRLDHPRQPGAGGIVGRERGTVKSVGEMRHRGAGREAAVGVSGERWRNLVFSFPTTRKIDHDKRTVAFVALALSLPDVPIKIILVVFFFLSLHSRGM